HSRRRWLRLLISVAAVVSPAVYLARAQNAMTPQTAYADGYVTANGLRLHYLDWGDPAKPAMILIHGNARHAHTFDRIVPECTRDYRVIALDMRGHGDSAWSAEGAYLVEDHVKDLEAVVRELGLRRVTLMGNSTGGRVVQVYTGLHPDNVERL